jgi:multidrug transporter EmrE-like cation transporter
MPIIFIKKYTETQNIMFIILSIFTYFILILSYSIVLVNSNITIIYPVLKVISILTVVLSGLIFFDDKLDIKSFFGITFGILSVYLLSSKINNKSVV